MPRGWWPCASVADGACGSCEVGSAEIRNQQHGLSCGWLRGRLPLELVLGRFLFGNTCLSLPFGSCWHELPPSAGGGCVFPCPAAPAAPCRAVGLTPGLVRRNERWVRNRQCEEELPACPGGRRQGGGRAFSPCPLPSPALGSCPGQRPGVPEESSSGAACPAQLRRALGASWGEPFVLQHLAHKHRGSSSRGARLAGDRRSSAVRQELLLVTVALPRSIPHPQQEHSAG